MENIEVILQVHCDADDSPSHAKIKITPALLKTINRLRVGVEKAKADTISVFDYTPKFVCFGSDWLDDNAKEEYTEWDGNIECLQLVVTKDYIQWEGLIKHTNINVTVEAIYMGNVFELGLLLNAHSHADLWRLRREINGKGLTKDILKARLELYKVFEAKENQLPLLLNSLKTDKAKELLEAKLKRDPDANKKELWL